MTKIVAQISEAIQAFYEKTRVLAQNAAGVLQSSPSLPRILNWTVAGLCAAGAVSHAIDENYMTAGIMAIIGVSAAMRALRPQ